MKGGNPMQDKEVHIKTVSQMLEEGLEQVFSTEYFRRFLAFIAGNPNYSYRNIILILQQCPHATRTMGPRSWMSKEERIVKAGERGLRINALFERDKDKEKDKEKPPIAPSKRNHKRQGESNFRRISVFDISQTRPLDGRDDQAPQNIAPAVNVFDITRLEGSVAGYGGLLRDLSEVSPLPIVFRSGMNTDGSVGYDGVAIKNDMSQLHTIRTIVNQIACAWLRADCPDREQLEIMSESVAFIVCQYLNLDTSEFSFHHIAKYSLGRERNALEKFLDVIQKTALYFIDTLDGIRAARRIGYATDEYFLFTNKKTAFRLFRQGYFMYLIYPGQGELLVMNKKDLEQYDGPFAVPRGDWFGTMAKAA
jgi:hypothetical protein